MAKFVIKCPSCGKYAQASTGFFANKKITCDCGYTIHVKMEKLSSRVCPHCGNAVVFDQSEGDKANCPVCNEPINTYSEMSKAEEISCEQCGVRLIVNKEELVHSCPVCNHMNDVAERLVSERIRRDGLVSIIKYEGDGETLVWKHPIEDFNYGSQLIVHESQEAIFFRDGQALDLFGSGRYSMETQQLPFLKKVYPLPTNMEGTFHSEVYFVNIATVMGVKWGTDSKVRMFDPASGLHVEIGASGEFNIHVIDSRRLLTKFVGTTGTFRQEQIIGTDGKGYFRAMIMTQVKSYLAQSIKESGISILEIDEKLMELSSALRDKLNNNLLEYGLEMPEFFVSRVITPDDDQNFKKMKEQYAAEHILVREERIKQKEAEAAAERKAVEARTMAQLQMIGAQGEAEALKIRAQAEAMEMKLKGYTYQQETSRQVGLEAMKNGLTGGASSGAGALGDLAGLGIGLGAMGGVIGMTKDAMSPMMGTASQMANSMADTFSVNEGEAWKCTCGNMVIAGNFCNICGAKKPERQADESWECTCGNKVMLGNFCNICGKRRGEQP